MREEAFKSSPPPTCVYLRHLLQTHTHQTGLVGFFETQSLFKSLLLVYTQAVIIFTIPESILPPTMDPAQSKIARPLATQPEKQGSWKRKVLSRVMDENFVGAETNVVTKHLKLSANATRAASSTAEKCQASVEDVEDDENILVNDSLLRTVTADDLPTLPQPLNTFR